MKICLVETVSNANDCYYSVCGDTFDLGGSSMIAFLPEFADCDECLRRYELIRSEKEKS